MKRHSGASWMQLLHAARGMRGHGGLSLSQAMMAAAAPMLLQTAMVEGDPERGVMSTGMVAGRITDIPTCRELIERIASDARERLHAILI